MKRRNIVLVLLVLLVAGGIGMMLVKKRQAARLAAERAAQRAAVQTASPAPAWGGQGSKKQWQDPEAREALKLVGADAIAEQYWIMAINNPNLSANERQDLIEDLNEEGYVDRRNPTAEDRKLIEHRLKLIEELSPHAMDEVNAAAFKEAQKDLTQMLNRRPR